MLAIVEGRKDVQHMNMMCTMLDYENYRVALRESFFLFRADWKVL